MTRIVCISDTHTRHNEVQVPECDILICAGDFSSTGKAIECLSFLNWFSAQKAKHLVYIAGNHDLSYERDIALKTQLVNQFPNVHYLEDSSITLDGLNIYGSPFSPTFGSWAFMLPRGKPIRDKWSQIPEDTDILITHSPPLGFGDCVSFTGERVGCVDLLERINRLPHLRLHAAGHIHQQPQQVIVSESITYVNASIVDDRYIVTNKPVVLEV
jgi:Icc-related predicted phosphoesterase